MKKLEECLNLMQRVCNLPTNDVELKKQGFDDESIEIVRNAILMFDPEASRELKRIKEIMDYIDK